MTLPKFDEDYFERGVEKHISGYTDYHWKPEYVLPLANWIKKKYYPLGTFPDSQVLDYGCAKGFLVKALRMFSINASGCDLSDYALTNGEPEVKEYLYDMNLEKNFINHQFTVVICKDVLEHIPKDKIAETLKGISRINNAALIAIIPLGDNGKFRIREYELDITHVTKEDEVWWTKQFNVAGYDLVEFYYSLEGIKDNWTKNFPYGNGIFILRKK